MCFIFELNVDKTSITKKTKCMKHILLLFLTLSYFASYSQLEYQDSFKIKIRGIAELGYLAVLNHNIQLSNSGTNIDYVKEGGQDVLFPVSRLSLELDLNPKNTIVLLYQPLKIETQVLLEEDEIIDDLTFPAGTSVNYLYNFPFYRISYLREFMSSNEIYSFAFGPTIQLRNATISFESTDGTLFRTNRDLGIVPALKLRTSAKLSPRVYTELEADGIYAPVSYLNGADNEIVGAILDASLRIGFQAREEVKTFLNLRYLGGGAVGTDPDSEGPGDGYVRNWLNFLTVSAGFAYEF